MTDDSLDEPLEAIAFLARSKNRVRVLETLSRDRQSQRELRNELSASRATLARILTDLENRNWIVQMGDRYDITALGELVITEFLPMVDLMATVQQLGDVFHLLPTDEMDLDLQSFSSAEVLIPDKSAPTKHMDRGLDLLRSVDQFRVLAWTALPAYLTVIRERTVAGDLRFEGVLGAGFLEELADYPSMVADFRQIVDAGGTLYRYDERVPYNMFIADETVFFWLCSSEGTEQAALVSSDESVRSWAEETFEAYRALAEPIAVTSFLP